MKIEIRNAAGQLVRLKKAENPELFTAIALEVVRKKPTNEITMDDLSAIGARSFDLNTKFGGGL